MTDRVRRLIEKNHQRTVFHALGMNIDKLDADETIISLAIDDRHYQHVGLVHGGIYVLMAESAASIAAACTLTDDSSSIVALEINANHLKSTTHGMLYAHSRALHQGKRTLVYEVRVVNEKADVTSIARCTLLVTSLSVS
jgi:1,4-dihydroxy-2-naphthoyl-CoA hydrolase